MARIPNAQLVSAAIKGDTDSFIVLCHRYYPAMLAVGRAILGDGHLCEDAAQEALAKACKKLHTLKNPDCFGPWLMAICRNEARNILRNRPETVSLEDRDIACNCTEEDTEVNLVRQAIDRLSVGAREIVMLRYRNNLSYEDIAALLDTTTQAVHGKLQRARKAIRKDIEHQRDRRLS